MFEKTKREKEEKPMAGLADGEGRGTLKRELYTTFLPLIGEGASEPQAADQRPQDLLKLLEKDKEQQRATVIWDKKLAKAAQKHVEDMAKRKYFSHITPEGVWPNQRVRESGYKLAADWPDSANYVESICAGQETAEEAWGAWMNSPTHRTHLLGLTPFFASETHVGVGFYEQEESPFWWYWCVVTAPAEVETKLRRSLAEG